jgi:peptidyl-prolyl cis-trans isomerase SurA
MTVTSRIKSTSMRMRVGMLAMLFVVAAGGSAPAQNVIVFVNGDPVTAIDVEQRTKFIILTNQNQKPPARQEVVDQLVDEKLKIREGKRWGIEFSDAEVNSSFSAMAARMNQTGDQLTQTLASKGINATTLKHRIRADSVWDQLIRGRYQARLQLSDREILARLEKPEERDTVGYDYVLRPILFLVPPGAPAATFEARRKEADALRKGFKGCTESIPAVRAMPNVAVRPQVGRSSADLPESLRKVLDSVPLGQLTAPEVTRHGVEMFAVCSKTETKTNTPERNKARQTLLGERFEQESKKYLQILRKNAMIEPGK